MALDPAEFTDDQLARLKRELTTTVRRMEAAIREALRDRRRGLTTEISQRLLRNLLDDYERLFGLAERRLLGISADVIEVVSDSLAEAGIADQLTTPSESLLRAQVGDGIDAIATIRGERIDALRATVLELSRSTVNPEEALAVLQGELGTTLAQTLTEVDTRVAAVDRTLSITTAEEQGYELFLYDGPVDSITRPWCAERLGYLFTLDELDEALNDTGPNPPSQYGGGYNCRHRIVPVDQSEWRRYPRWQGRPYPDEDERALAA
jgi:hypothetical protein